MVFEEESKRIEKATNSKIAECLMRVNNVSLKNHFLLVLLLFHEDCRQKLLCFKNKYFYNVSIFLAKQARLSRSSMPRRGIDKCCFGNVRRLEI